MQDLKKCFMRSTRFGNGIRSGNDIHCTFQRTVLSLVYAVLLVFVYNLQVSATWGYMGFPRIETFSTLPIVLTLIALFMTLLPARETSRTILLTIYFDKSANILSSSDEGDHSGHSGDPFKTLSRRLP